MPPCSCSAASRLAPAGRRRPPLGRLPCSCCRLPATDVRHSAHSASLPPASHAVVPGCRPRPPAHPALRALRRSSLPTRLDMAAPPASLPPCSTRRCLPPCSARRCLPPWPLPPWLPASLLRARLLGCLPGWCAAVPGAGHPALRASGASLLDRLHCSPGSSALCDCASLPGIVFAS
jgi:hypothetical protein